MNTPSHFLINYSLGRFLRLRERHGVRMGAVIWGSLAPDIMLYLLAAGMMIYGPRFRGWSIGYALDYAFDTLFFENIWWIALHNFLQAPLLLIAIIAVAGVVLRSRRHARQTRGYTIALWVFIFAISALVHTVLDILTHHDDGPLLLFPFNFTVRFVSPVSYWDFSHYGQIFVIFEVVVDALCIWYLIHLRRMSAKGITPNGTGHADR